MLLGLNHPRVSSLQGLRWAYRWHAEMKPYMDQVNERLGVVEKAEGVGDPAHPKQQWPPPELCPVCRAPPTDGSSVGAWNEAEVLHFLQNFYDASRPRSFGGRKDLTDGGATEAAAIATCVLGPSLDR